METQNEPTATYCSKHIKESNAFTKSLKALKSPGKRRIIVPQYETSEHTGRDQPTVNLPAEVYKFQSVLFNSAIVVKNGTVKIEEKFLHRLDNLEKLFIFLRRFRNRDMQEFISVFEDAITAFVENNRAEDVGMNFSRLHELQHLFLD